MSRIQSHYNITFDVLQEAQTTDPGGALVPGTTERSTGNDGKLDMLSGSNQLYNEKHEVIADYMLFCDIITIEETDQVLIDAVYYDVVRVNPLNYGSNPHSEVYLKRRT